ncbi:sugar phosphate isomerase/epimerase [Erwiniaceae bacterium BAC15a-03b]|uniref:Sugar phosphate isomerase/epimerase n=1 Tax=Winslowiella arboricola TaxID=2978220 RepID=A0A9J6PNE9_9GAMM|nr:sugar phosphate isomerase/epimerase [Winslowiella arboricola]MCU5772332.1 sugar phosphate isomerase/epimerase [Winslowiella arboricola]MCU5776196.1 sugar phosphate isomerase/epimerase [Winslowiella arboricola]
MKREVIVVTAAYGQQQVKAAGGQQGLLPVIAEAGADGVEIRRELLSAEELQRLPELGHAIKQHQLIAFYSVPEALFMADGTLNPQLDQRVDEASQLNAQLLKFSLGNYARGFDCQALQQRLAAYPLHVVVENDQTESGKRQPLEDFFADCAAVRMPNSMTFDMANWLWVGDDPRVAAENLGRFVSYVHVKAAAAHHDTYRAVALDDSDGSWRELLKRLPADVPRGIEFPLEGDDLTAVTRYYVNLLREE